MITPKNVWISIRGRQVSGEDVENIELVTDGQLYRESAGGVCLTYAEDDLSGMGKTRTTLMIEPGRVTMVRSGDVNSQMVFELGRRHMSYYDTEYGTMTVGVNTSHITCDITEREVDIDMAYTLEVDHAVAGANLISIHAAEGLDGAHDPRGTLGYQPDRFVH